MLPIIGAILSIIFLLLSALHLYWGFGGKWAVDAAVPTNEKHQKLFTIGIVNCVFVALGLLGFAVLVLVKTALVDLSLPMWLLKYGVWTMAFIFIARSVGEFRYVGFFKKVRITRFADIDTKFYTPLCLFIGILAILVALG